MVPVFNHTKRQIGIAISHRKEGMIGPQADVVEFGPGNNSITRIDLERCETHPAWADHVERRERRDLTGRRVKGVNLTVNMHDEEFEVEFKSLGEKMRKLHELRVG